MSLKKSAHLANALDDHECSPIDLRDLGNFVRLGRQPVYFGVRHTVHTYQITREKRTRCRVRKEGCDYRPSVQESENSIFPSRYVQVIFL